MARKKNALADRRKRRGIKPKWTISPRPSVRAFKKSRAFLENNPKVHSLLTLVKGTLNETGGRS